MKRRVGAILVREKRIVATGYALDLSERLQSAKYLLRYNGTPRGLTNCNEGGCSRCNGTAASNEACLCLHAEENALLEAGRDRIEGATLYCNTCVHA
jgi:dCMP deaminase